MFELSREKLMFNQSNVNLEQQKQKSQSIEKRFDIIRNE